MGKRTIRVRRTFTPQFKKDAVHLVVEEGKSLTEVATHLGIARSLLQRWREQLTDTPTEAFPGRGRLAPQARRVRELEQKLREVTQERDILKNGLGGQAPTWSTRNSGRGTRRVGPGGETDRFLAHASPLKNMVQGLLRT